MPAAPPQSAAPPATPPRPVEAPSKPPLTPEQVRRIETNRLRAKAIREARERGEVPPSLASHVSSSADPAITGASTSTTNAVSSSSSKKRPHDGLPSNSRQGGAGAGEIRPLRPAKKFAKYVDYDLSKMTDTKGGFLATTDDPFSVLSAENLQDKPAGMTLEEWARHQQWLKSRKSKHDPPLSVFHEKDEDKQCRDCGSREIDFRWREVFKLRVCEKCKRSMPEKYSLLTKTEAREDYLLTDPELRDEELLPHLVERNPHKSTWSNMMLYVRCQVEEFATKKWGSLDKMDEEFEKRVKTRKERRDKKFVGKLREMRDKTRVDQWKRERGKKIAGRHEHRFGNAIDKGSGECVRTCEECGFEVEELVF